MKQQVGCFSLYLEKIRQIYMNFFALLLLRKCCPGCMATLQHPRWHGHLVIFFFFFKYKKKMKQEYIDDCKSQDCLAFFFFDCLCWFSVPCFFLSQWREYTSIRWNSFCPWISRGVTWASSAEPQPAQFWVNYSFYTHIHFLDAASPPPASPLFDRLRETVTKSWRWLPALHHSSETFFFFFFNTREKISVEREIRIAALLSKPRSNETNAEDKKKCTLFAFKYLQIIQEYSKPV